MRVSATERGLVRLFAVDLPGEEIENFRTPKINSDGELADWPLDDALGFSFLDEDFIELFPVSDLEDLGLTGYMVEGLGIAQKDVDEDATRLAAQKGWVLVVLSAAFGGVAQTLTPKSPLRWIGTYKEEAAPIQFTPLPDTSAKGAPLPPETDPAPTPAQRSPYLTLLVALVALPLCAAFLGLLILWMIG
ncbi:hypothetical protein [Shimia sp. MMG029]|uniref:hypothetical protein n=1 Tax=Shimia sp. MMG029 TaxID=3021978 RepID=UPI0022FF3874|nr:hypothetical protein [Shimia sp. MMG029]MDA5558300.1 hypothetical protein [Shimia sp. MMG029]